MELLVLMQIILIGKNCSPKISETEEGIAEAIVQSDASDIDFEREPWPKVSENAKDLVKSMLDPNPYSRLTAQEVLGMSPFLLPLVSMQL